MRAGQISLLFGIPLSQEEFAFRLSPDLPEMRSDYLARFADEEAVNGRDRLERAWQTDYWPGAASPYAELEQHAKDLGCEVGRAATLADLQVAARAGQVVVLIAHWKDAAFLNDDFLPGVETILAARLDGRAEPLACWIREALNQRTRALGLWRKPALSARQALRASLTAKIVEPTPIGIDESVELPSTTAARRRDLLDLWLEGALRPGNRLELFDGLHSREAVASALSQSAPSVLDLTICTATYLGDYVGRRNEHRFRTVQAIRSQDPTDAAIRLWAVLKLAVQDDLDYLVARLRVAGIYQELVKREAGSRASVSQ
jgi:hypothetical protein